MTASRLYETLNRLSTIAASAVVARGRIASPALNAVLLRRLSAEPGEMDAILADPMFEIARAWKLASKNLGDLAGGLLHPDLVTAMDEARAERMPRDRHPYSHQIDAWEAARAGLSCLVSSGTGSGKTECFMVPILDDLLRDSTKGKLAGVRAIVIYPLNALIESQRERLAAWTEALNNRISFALYNGLTPETPRNVDKGRLAASEIGDRQTIRENPPSILVTNVTMLEYLLLRTQDRTLLERSQKLLRWIVLDEAHSYIGAQAAEMALLLRRVRAAFGVEPDQVRLMATSATISDGDGTEAKLKRFVADLAGLSEERVKVIEGHSIDPELPGMSADVPLDLAALTGQTPAALWDHLACHPRIRELKRVMSKKGVTLSQAAEIFFGHEGKARRIEAQSILDAAAHAQCPATQARLVPWRAHLFHRAQGGIWVCIDSGCIHRDGELVAEGAGWGFGAVWMTGTTTSNRG
ncbi:MAG: DEAD/DEAH box helicase [Magnetococcales bacterium]|nr:DEAD/DEAH box helicase [Magnetococcales bacterium]